MKQRLLFLFRLYLVYIAWFALMKPAFMFYNGNWESTTPTGFTFTDIVEVIWHGLAMDASTAGYLMAVPLLLTWISIYFPHANLKKWLTPYYVLTSILVVAIETVDTSLYEFWKFKIDATIFNYIDAPGEALASVSIGFVAVRLIVFICFTAFFIGCLRFATPTHMTNSKWRWQKQVLSHTLFLLTGGILFLFIRGGVAESTMNIGNAYYCDRLFLNHAAVNPAFSLIASLGKSEDFASKYDYFDEATRKALMQGIYPNETEDIADTLLCQKRPNVLLLILEGYGGTFIDGLGAHPEVSPNLNALLSESIFFNKFYANSFRTDRGVLCTLSGHISYPTTSLMKIPAKSQKLSSLARSLRKSGYTTSFLYGGDINFTNMKSYLHNMGYESITGSEGFTLAERNSSAWGANDSITLNRLLDDIQKMPQDKPWHAAYLSLSSHEPFEVPYRRLEDKRLNAFAYTDHCVGEFIRQLKQTDQWKNLLVVCLPDHGFLFDTFYTDPTFFHVPMLWLGGAIRNPRVVTTLMNQSDLAATLLSQLGIAHKDFTYSRNVFSKHYTHPFVYTTFSDGFMLTDSTGTTVFDNAQQKAVICHPADGGKREQQGKAILQTSYDRLGKM